jgi:hypothetical protein
MRRPRTPATLGLLAVLNWIVGVIMVASVITAHQDFAWAGSSDCTTEAGQWTCASDEACCNGTCFDPDEYACACDGTLVSIPSQ